MVNSCRWVARILTKSGCSFQKCSPVLSALFVFSRFYPSSNKHVPLFPVVLSGHHDHTKLNPLAVEVKKADSNLTDTKSCLDGKKQDNLFSNGETKTRQSEMSCRLLNSRRFNQKRRYFVLGYITFVVFVIEIGCYFSSFYDWPLFVREYSNNPPDKLLKILVVADPQLIGYENEGSIGIISRYDSDKYLRRTFSTVFNYIEPQLILFLGDLFDEGSIVDNGDFDVTWNRFHSIYPVDTLGIQHIFIPGDNDVGGEGWEPVKEDKVTRFNRRFVSTFNPKQIMIPDYYFFATNLFDVGKTWPINVMGSTDQPGETRVLLSHAPITAGYHHHAEDVFVSIKPALIFSGHDHVGRAIITHRNSSDYEYIQMRPSSGDYAGTQIAFPINMADPAEATLEMQEDDTTARKHTA